MQNNAAVAQNRVTSQFQPTIGARTANSVFSAKLSVWKGDDPVVAPGSERMTTFSASALYSGGVQLDSGHVDLRVIYSNNTTPENPIMLVSGIDVDGRPFAVEVAINKIDPEDASIIEMFALNAYSRTKGWPVFSILSTGGSLQHPLGANADAFTGANWLAHFIDRMETQRYHNNLLSYMENKEKVDALMEFLARKQSN
jgi:hypothetical protein